MQTEIDKLKSSVIRLGGYALKNRPFVDTSMTRKELIATIEKADEALRQVGLRSRKIFDAK